MQNTPSTALVSPKGLTLILVICLGLSVMAIALRADSLRLDSAVLGVLIAWCGSVPSFLYLIEPAETRAPFPFAPLVGVFYAIFFGLSVFVIFLLRDPATGYLNEYGSILIETLSLETQILILAGVILMFVTWALCSRLLFKKAPRFRVSGTVTDSHALLMAWVLAISCILYYLMPAVQNLPSVGQFFKPAGIIAFSIFSYYFAHRKLPRRHAVLYFLIAFPIWVFGLLQTGSSTLFILIISLFLINQMCARNRIPWLPMTSIPLVILLLYPALQSYRHFVWVYDPGAGLFARFVYLGDSAVRFGAFDLTEKKARLLGLARRLSTQVSLNRVIQMTPKPIPYLNGETYKPLVSSWIPRVLWPDKPLENAGEAFGHRYQWIKPHLKNQSMNIPWMVEMYANFGRYGLLIGMGLVGMMLSFLDRFFNRRGMNPLEIATGTALLLPLTFPDSNLSLMTGSLLPLTLCLWICYSVGVRMPLPDFIKSALTPNRPL